MSDASSTTGPSDAATADEVRLVMSQFLRAINTGAADAAKEIFPDAPSIYDFIQLAKRCQFTFVACGHPYLQGKRILAKCHVRSTAPGEKYQSKITWEFERRGDQLVIVRPELGPLITIDP